MGIARRHVLSWNPRHGMAPAQTVDGESAFPWIPLQLLLRPADAAVAESRQLRAALHRARGRAGAVFERNRSVDSRRSAPNEPRIAHGDVRGSGGDVFFASTRRRGTAA